MNFTSDALLELIHLERRPSTLRRVASVAGLMLGGGLIGAAVVMMTKTIVDAGTSKQAFAAPRPAHALPPSYDRVSAGYGEGDSHV